MKTVSTSKTKAHNKALSRRWGIEDCKAILVDYDIIYSGPCTRVCVPFKT